MALHFCTFLIHVIIFSIVWLNDVVTTICSYAWHEIDREGRLREGMTTYFFYSHLRPSAGREDGFAHAVMKS